jgi:hypothetical protein
VRRDGALVAQADALRLPLRDESIDLIATSPPYFAGTVPMVARALGRLGVGVDLSHAYCRLAQWRIWESGHASKAEQRTWRDAQTGLFTEAG